MAKKNIVSFLNDISKDLCSGLKLETLLDKLLDKALEFNRATVGLIMLQGQDKDKIDIKISKGNNELK